MSTEEFEPDPSAVNYYDRLGVSRTAGQETIDEAGKHAKSTYHPDRHEADVHEEFDRIRSAQAVLGDEDDRAAYDTFVDRYGAETATEAFERWEMRSRPAPPEEFEPEEPAGAADRSLQARTKDWLTDAVDQITSPLSSSDD
jgi:DnaJ-class molecular chaperone